MTIDMSMFNKNQCAAVEWQDGPLLVLAGPGAGKSHLFAYRIARLIDESPLKHFHILGLTSADVVAADLERQVHMLVPRTAHRRALTTFQSFAAHILRWHGHFVGLDSYFKILSCDEDRRQLLDKVIGNSRYRFRGMDSERLLPLITMHAENNLSPEQLKKTGKATERTLLIDPDLFWDICRDYRRAMIEQNMLDIPAIVSEFLRLIQTNDRVCDSIRQVYHYFCVDGLQNMNSMEYEILKQIIRPDRRNLFVVADDDQVIYPYSGNSPSCLQALRDDFDMQVLHLPESHCCPEEIIDTANRLILHNSKCTEVREPLAARRTLSSVPLVSCRSFRNFADEATWVARDIAKRLEAERADCIVLARTGKLLDTVVQALDREGIANLAARKDEFGSPAMKWLYSVLRLAGDRSSRASLREVCDAFFLLSGAAPDVRDVVARSKSDHMDYFRSWIYSVYAHENIEESHRKFVYDTFRKYFLECSDWLSFQKGAFEWLDEIVGIKSKPDGVIDEYETEKADWQALVQEYGGEGIALQDLFERIDRDLSSHVAPQNAVPCVPLYAAKGFEFRHVYLIGLVEGQFPTWNVVKDGPDSWQMQEERRNCFAAVTRAQETLTLTWSAEVQGWKKSPSRFLEEMGLVGSCPVN